MADYQLKDWNDVQLLLACAEHGSFASAAAALGMDQTTVSRRIGILEQVVGRPLFHRRRSGAAPTPAGLALLEKAKLARSAIEEFEHFLTGLRPLPEPIVTLSASEGLLTYTLIPVLLGESQTPQPLDSTLIRWPLPQLAFTSRPRDSDIAIIATSAGDLPHIQGAVHVRRIGMMHFVPTVGQALLQKDPRPIGNFDALGDRPLLDIGIYRPLKSLDAWHGLVARHRQPDRIALKDSTRSMHKSLTEGEGFGILPSYSRLYEPGIDILDCATPTMAASLWLVAHEDKLREPAVRTVYDTLCTLFVTSPWFKTTAIRF